MKLLVLAIAVFAIANGKSLFRLRGLERDNDWFGPLKALGTEVITEVFGLEDVKDKVEATVDRCMQADDTTDCLKKEVDAVSDALGQDVPQAERDDAKMKVGFFSDFLGAVYKNCGDVDEEKIGECAMNTGKRFCSFAGDKKDDCMKGVIYVLGKAKKMQEQASGAGKRGIERSDEWFDGLSALGTEIITETFDLDGVKDKVKGAVEGCMQEDDTTACLKKEVDTVSDALGKDVPQNERDEAKEKVGFLSDFLGAVYTNCKDLEEDKVGDCAFNTGKQFCSNAGDRQEECMKGVFYILGKAKKMHDKARKGGKRGLDRDDELFDEIRDFASAVIVDTFDLEGVKDKVKGAVEGCMQEDDTTACLKKEVDNVSDALGKDVPQNERDDAKEKVGFLSDFLGAVYTNCKDVEEDKAGECAMRTGKEFCSQAGDRKRDCMKGVQYILGKAKEMYAKQD